MDFSSLGSGFDSWGVDIQAWCVRIKGLRTQREQETPRDSLKKFGLLWQLEILSVEQTYGRANCLSVFGPLPLSSNTNHVITKLWY